MKKTFDLFTDPLQTGKYLQTKRLTAWRVLLITGFIGYLLFGFLQFSMQHENNINLIVRIVISVFGIFTFFGSYYSRWIRQHLITIVHLFFHIVTLYTLQICYENNFRIEHFFPFITIISVVGMSHLNLKILFRYLIGTFLLSGMTILFCETDLPKYIILGSISMISTFVYFAMKSKFNIEEELILRENFMKSIFDESPDSIFLMDVENDAIESYNHRAIELFKLKGNSELIGKRVSSLNKVPFSDDEQKEIKQIIAEKGSFSREIIFRTHEGQEFWGELSLIETQLKQKDYYIVRISDISARKKAEEQIRLLESVVITSNEAVVITTVIEENKTWPRINYVNEAFTKITGYSSEEMMGESPMRLIGPETNLEDLINLRKGIIDGEAVYAELLNYKKDGNSFWVDIQIKPLYNNVGKQTHLITIFRDITDKKAFETLLKYQEQLFEGASLATSKLLTIQNFDDAVEEALQIIGEAAKADRAFVYQIKFDSDNRQSFMEARYEWVQSGIESRGLIHRDYTIYFKQAGLQNWEKSFSEHKSIKGTRSELSTSEVNFMDKTGTKSVLEVPIFINEILWGFIGLDDCKLERQWTITDENVLQTIANSLGGAISRNKVRKQLIEAKNNAENAFKAKSEFLASMSHEIRTPMNAVIGLTDLLCETDLTEEQEDYVRTVKVSGENLLTVINNVLDYSKIESGKMDLENRHLNTENLLKETFDLFVRDAIAKNILINFSIQENVPKTIIGDSVRIKQILINLVGNAMKFTQDGTISIHLKTIGNTNNSCVLQFSVIDSGVGISQDKIPALFQSFSQADRSTTRQYGGSGLGLSICQKLVKLMGGKIWVESEKGIGSKFHFIIETRVLEDLHLPNPLKPILLNSESSNSKIDKTLSDRVPIRILIAEDNLINQKVATRILEKMGYKPDVVNNGYEAVDAVRKIAYDLVLMDIQMPELNGLEATKMIIEDDHIVNKPIIIAMTANALDGDREICLNVGMNDYLSKPIRIDDLQNVITKWMNQMQKTNPIMTTISL